MKIEGRQYKCEGSFSGCEKAVLVEEFEGVYSYIFEFRDSKVSKFDFLDDSIEEAMARCLEDFGIPREAWKFLDCPP